jgi:hypothetical protein
LARSYDKARQVNFNTRFFLDFVRFDKRSTRGLAQFAPLCACFDGSCASFLAFSAALWTERSRARAARW